MGQEANLDIPMKGGLNLSSNISDILATPGTCSELYNYEISPYGGYRRINGFSNISTSPVEVGDGAVVGRVLAVAYYADGYLAARGDGLFWSPDNVVWYQVNRDATEVGLHPVTEAEDDGSITVSPSFFVDHGAVTDATLSEVIDSGLVYVATELTETILPRTSQKSVDFLHCQFHSNDYGAILVLSPDRVPAFFEITNIGGVRSFTYKELPSATTGVPNNAYVGAIYQKRAFLATPVSNRNVLFWSDINKADDFTGAGAGFVQVDEPIVALKGFREAMYIFTANSIYRFSKIEEGGQLEHIARNIGCVSQKTIQEVGGDIVFLSYSGFRTLSGTERFQDLELGVISRNIQPIVTDLITNFSSYTVSSLVINDKNQYRIFFSREDSLNNKGLSATLVMREQGPVYEWTELYYFDVSSTYFNDSQIIHGSLDGYIYKHDSGPVFSSGDTPESYQNIRCNLKTNDISFGDYGIKKTLHNAILNIHLEGALDYLSMKVGYDFDRSSVHQPPAVALGGFSQSSKFGSALFGTGVFGLISRPPVKRPLIGSGNSAHFQIFDAKSSTEDGIIEPYTISNINVLFKVGKRL